MNEQKKPDIVNHEKDLSPVGVGSIDSQIATAKQYPRSIKKCKEEAIDLATMNREIAQKCHFSFYKGGNMIEGPSIRLAEIFVYSWKNFRASSKPVEVMDRKVKAVGLAIDLEKNSAVKKESTQSIMDKHDNRYSDDMIKQTMNATCSIALRNAVFSVIPRVYVMEVCKKAKQASLPKGETLKERRQKMLKSFNELGISKEMIFRKMDGVHGLDDIGREEIHSLQGLYNAINEGQINKGRVFGGHSGRTDPEIDQWLEEDEDESSGSDKLDEARQWVAQMGPPESLVVDFIDDKSESNVDSLEDVPEKDLDDIINKPKGFEKAVSSFADNIS